MPGQRQNEVWPEHARERLVVNFVAALLTRGDRTHSPSSFCISNIILPLAWQCHVGLPAEAGEGRGKFGCLSKSAAMRLWSQANVHHVKNGATTQSPYQTID